jgi:H+/Cl- antiporter ClcA
LTIAASGGSALTLRILKSSAFVETPAYNWSLNLQTVLLLVLLGAAGYAVTYGLGGAHDAGRKLMQYTTGKPWWVHGLFASLTLSLLYLLGGSLVQFTGNESTVPMFKQSADLGLWGLLWIAVIKIAAISWSKASGYRGGLIFPTVFVASVIVAATRLYAHDINLIYGLIAVLIGALYADKRVKILL